MVRIIKTKLRRKRRSNYKEVGGWAGRENN